jgi:hypothetical protein
MTTAPGRLVQMVKDVVAAFARHGIRHAVAGGMAVAAHGLPRATKNIDVLIDARDLDKARTALEELGFAVLAQSGGDGFHRFVRNPMSGLPEITEWVDVICAHQETGRALLREAAQVPLRWQDSALPVVSVEGLVLMKLLAMHDNPSRLQDRVDILGLIALHRTTINLDWLKRATGALGPTYAEQLENLLRDAGSAPSPTATGPGL